MSEYIEALGFIYLASPYTHPDKAVMQKRFEQVCKKAGKLMELGNKVFCPIAMGHAISDNHPGMPTSLGWWLEQDFPILKQADKLIVYRMDGWEESAGVGAEIAFAKAAGIPIVHMEPL